jgi:hypothetical protein
MSFCLWGFDSEKRNCSFNLYFIFMYNFVENSFMTLSLVLCLDLRHLLDLI